MAMSDAIRDFESGTDDTAEEAKTGVDDATGAVKHVADKVGQKAEEVAQFAAQTYHGAKDIAAQNLGDFEREIRERPVQAALIAAGVGLMVGMLFARGRSYPNLWNGFESPGRRRIRMTRRRLREEFDNQISRAEHAWDSIHGSDRVRDIGRYLNSQRRRWVS
jgi:ElaB/YqjD/DUF883 family membrane-anchored ribosome-binding protein